MAAYIQHLAQVDEIQPVTVKTNISNTEGKVLVGTGTRLTKDVAAMLRGKVNKSCETAVELEAGFTAEVVFELFQQFIVEEPSFLQIAESVDCSTNLVRAIEAFSESPELLQRFNVLAIQLPDVFDQALFCSWFTVLCLANEKVSQQRISQSFTAAVAHDFGLLDIEPELIFKKGALSPEEWQELQQHPRLGAEFLRRVSGVEVETIRGVLEHHEANNGTGYPGGKYQNQLGEIGRLLHILDSANAIFRKHFRHRKRSLHDMVPILQINTLSRGDVYAELMIKLFNKSSATEHCTLSEEIIDDAATTLKGDAVEIQSFIDITSEFKKTVGVRHRDIKVLALQDIAKQVKSTMDTCGIINEAYLRWIDQVRAERLDFAYRELEDVLLMSNEIKFHIHRFNRELNLYLEQSKNVELLEPAKALRASLDAIEKGAASDGVMEYLEGV